MTRESALAEIDAKLAEIEEAIAATFEEVGHYGGGMKPEHRETLGALYAERDRLDIERRAAWRAERGGLL